MNRILKNPNREEQPEERFLHNRPPVGGKESQEKSRVKSGQKLLVRILKRMKSVAEESLSAATLGNAALSLMDVPYRVVRLKKPIKCVGLNRDLSQRQPGLKASLMRGARNHLSAAYAPPPHPSTQKSFQKKPIT